MQTISKLDVKRYNNLPKHIQDCISNNKFDCNSSKLDVLQILTLNGMSADELFDSFLTWNGFIGYTAMIHNAHVAIYKGGD